jgi:hypothetical protein
MSAMTLSAGYLGTRMTLAIAPPLRPSAAATRQVTCMAKKKGIRCIITLECTEARALGETPSRYVTQKVGVAVNYALKRRLRLTCSPRYVQLLCHAENRLQHFANASNSV